MARSGRLPSGKASRSRSASVESKVINIESEKGSESNDSSVESDGQNAEPLSERLTRKKTQRIRRHYTKDRKLEIMAYAEEHGNPAAALKFSVDPSNVRKWRKLASLEKLPSSSSKVTRSRSAELESKLINIESEDENASDDSSVEAEEINEINSDVSTVWDLDSDYESQGERERW